MTNIGTTIIDIILNNDFVQLFISAIRSVPKMFKLIFNVLLKLVDIINIFPSPINWILLLTLFSLFIKAVVKLVSILIELIPSVEGVGE